MKHMKRSILDVANEYVELNYQMLHDDYYRASGVSLTKDEMKKAFRAGVKHVAFNLAQITLMTKNFYAIGVGGILHPTEKGDKDPDKERKKHYLELKKEKKNNGK